MSEWRRTPQRANTVAYATSLVVKATPGILYSAHIYNSLGSAQWIQLHDAASLPANTAIPILTLACATVANLEIDFGDLGLAFTSGIVIANSTTGPTLTIGAANCYITARYV